MGWLGWNEKDSLDTDVNSILIAMEGKLDMMYPEAREKANRKLNPDKFKAFAAAHNANFKEKKQNGKR